MEKVQVDSTVYKGDIHAHYFWILVCTISHKSLIIYPITQIVTSQ